MNTFDITKEDVLNLAAQKLADQFSDNAEIDDIVRSKIEQRVKERFDSSVNGLITNLITEHVSKLMAEEINPVDIWGNRTGKPTTIRAAIADRAKAFWTELVNGEGRPETYGGRPRCEWLFAKVANDEFTKVVKQDIVNLVGAFKNAMIDNAAKITKEHIDSLIRVQTNKG
jgi:hypothetical protein